MKNKDSAEIEWDQWDESFGPFNPDLPQKGDAANPMVPVIAVYTQLNNLVSSLLNTTNN